MDDAIFAAAEFKFADNAATGEFSGYAAMFGNVDSHGDLIVPGAFGESLAERKAQNRSIPMHVMHRVFGGDGLPVGVWKTVEEDAHGLAVEGKISGMNTDVGRLLYERVKDGALGGLSIGYSVKKNGASYGTKAGEPKRTLKKLHLGEISLVDDPSNAMTRVMELKAARDAEAMDLKAVLGLIERDKAAQAVAEAMSICMSTMSGGDSPTVDERKAMLQRLQDAHEVITGSRMPAGMKSVPETIREFEAAVRTIFGISNKQARALAEHGFKALAPRDEEDKQATAAVEEGMKSSLNDLTNFAAGFSLMGA